MTMNKNKPFSGVSIRTKYLIEIENIIEKDPTFQYASKSDFVNNVVRDKLKEYHKSKIKDQD